MHSLRPFIIYIYFFKTSLYDCRNQKHLRLGSSTVNDTLKWHPAGLKCRTKTNTDGADITADTTDNWERKHLLNIRISVYISSRVTGHCGRFHLNKWGSDKDYGTHFTAISVNWLTQIIFLTIKWYIWRLNVVNYCQQQSAREWRMLL